MSPGVALDRGRSDHDTPLTAADAERHVFVVCDGEACRHAGSNGLLGLLRGHRPGFGQHHDVRISASRCIGRCTMAPAMVQDGRILGWVSLRRLRVELMRLGLMRKAA